MYIYIQSYSIEYVLPRISDCSSPVQYLQRYIYIYTDVIVHYRIHGDSAPQYTGSAPQESLHPSTRRFCTPGESAPQQLGCKISMYSIVGGAESPTAPTLYNIYTYIYVYIHIYIYTYKHTLSNTQYVESPIAPALYKIYKYTYIYIQIWSYSIEYARVAESPTAPALCNVYMYIYVYIYI